MDKDHVVLVDTHMVQEVVEQILEEEVDSMEVVDLAFLEDNRMVDILT